MRVYERRVSRMRRRIAVWLAWSLAGLSVAMILGSIALFILVRFAQSPGDHGTGPSAVC
jgi:hypothetical protein